MDAELISAREALDAWFHALDAEAWDEVALALDEDAQLADDLTTEWLRGRDRVGSYLRAQQGIVTDIVTTPSKVAFQDLGSHSVLATFELKQRYRLDGVERSISATGCAILRRHPDGFRLSLFHLAQAGADRAAGEAGVDAPESEAPRDGQLADDVVAGQVGDRAGHGADEPTKAPHNIGEEIRRRRTRAGQSLRELAERAQLSPSFLSQVERSQADPSVSSLRQIAAGLGTDASVLLGAEAPSANPFRRGTAADRARFRVSEAGITVEGFAGFTDGVLEAYIAEPGRADGWQLEREASAEEFIFVLAGTLEVEIQNSLIVLRPGDGVHVRSSTPYRLAGRHAPSALRYLVVQTRPARQAWAAATPGPSDSSTITPSGLST
ncbi:MAG TPA: helix-turn-helix domain-containing protein [Solirubrobacteraceae bacterium]|jgi:transcriptional regulator with XRE-family HTH domain|nr:helix-turn-helix domain-containing protein [Solirubrobacteraceae bacterium]